MSINPLIFREYDIRGVVDKDITPEVARQIGLGFGTYIRRSGRKRLSLGRDCRLSSPRLKEALADGLLSTGCDVLDVGMVTTPLLYFSLHTCNVDGGVMITGSHLPRDRNGFKLCQGMEPLHGDEIQKVREIIQGQHFEKGKGNREAAEIVIPYIEYIKERIKLGRSVKVATDCGNGMAGIIAPRLFRELGCQVVELYSEPDGTFPNHHPDPTIPEYMEDLSKTVASSDIEVGIGFDGDADRIGVLDQEGRIIWGDKLLLFLSRDLLNRRPGARVIFDVKCSQTLEDDIKKHGGVPLMWKSGHSLIKAKMREEKALLAGEMSGHIFVADEYFGFDDAVYAACRVLRILSESGQSISDMLADVPETFSTPEIRVENDSLDEIKFHLVKEISDHFKGKYRTIDIDGVRIIFEEGWGLIRASNTQPALVLRFESTSREGLERIEGLVYDYLRSFPQLKDVIP